MDLHSFLISKGFVVEAIPDHDNDNLQATIYKKDSTGERITYEEYNDNYLKSFFEDPTTGTTTPEQANKLLWDITSEYSKDTFYGGRK